MTRRFVWRPGRTPEVDAAVHDLRAELLQICEPFVITPDWTRNAQILMGHDSSWLRPRMKPKQAPAEAANVRRCRLLAPWGFRMVPHAEYGRGRRRRAGLMPFMAADLTRCPSPAIARTGRLSAILRHEISWSTFDPPPAPT
jgi:hypothetical protein